MNIPAPHFLLFSEARGKARQGQWRFVLQAADGSATFEASDLEPDIGGERLELLAVIRGLEALDQPSRVTLFTPSNYVSRGMAYGLEEWRRNGWTWECFGEMVPVKNRDLWQRLDRALTYHTIEFRIRRTDEAHAGGTQPSATVGNALRGVPQPTEPSLRSTMVVAGTVAALDGAGLPTANQGDSYRTGPADPSAITVKTNSRHGGRRLTARLGRSLRERAESWKLRCGQFGTAFLPKPWLQ